MERSPAIKVGLLTLISLMVLIGAIVWLRGKGLGVGDGYTVYFRDVDGMREGAAVQYMGIRVGFVDEIGAMFDKRGRYLVKVLFKINDPKLKIPRGSNLSIQQSGIIGEKFIEITPPELQTVVVTLFKHPEQPISQKMPVKFLYEEGYMDVGQAELIEELHDKEISKYKLAFQITRPGAVMPTDPVYTLVPDSKQGAYLRVLPREALVIQAPDPNQIFTVEDPMRLKQFLDIQFQSALALKQTNDRVNALLSDATIANLNKTLKNTELLTARATSVMDSANKLFVSTSHDLDKLVRSTDELTESITAVSANLNDVMGNPQLKKDIVTTVASIEKSTKTLSEILNDPSLKETLAMAQSTSRDASELMAMLKQTAHDKEIQEQLSGSLTLLNSSLQRLSGLLANLETVSSDKESLKSIIEDTRTTTQNLSTFSEKLNKRFLLFRMMF